MERGIRRAFHKATTDSNTKQHPLNPNDKAYLSDAGNCRDGFKSINEHLLKFAKYTAPDETPYNKLGAAINRASLDKFDHMSKIDTFKRVMKEMQKTMMDISHIEYTSHEQIRNLMKNKFDPFTNKRIPDLQKQARKLDTYIADHEISQSKVEAAKLSDHKAREKALKQQRKNNYSNLASFQTEYKEHDAQEKIKQLEFDQDQAEYKLNAETEKVKIDLLEFDAETPEMAEHFKLVVNHLQMFHKQAGLLLDELMPKLDYELSNYKKKFAIDKIGHICSDSEPIAKPLFIIIDHLLANEGLTEEGLFRLPGAITKVKQICAALNAPNFDEDIMEEFCPSNQALASALKQFFRDLGSPILGKLMDNSKIAKVEQEKQQNERFYQIAELLDGLDEYERYNLAYLCRFCREVKEHQKVNLMSANALAICWAPTLIGQTSTSGVGTFFVQECIEWADDLFPDNHFPKLEQQGLDFKFSQRATELMERNKNKSDNVSDDYGFIGRDVVSSNEQQAQSVLNNLKPYKARKKPAPGAPNAVSLSSNTEQPRVQILHSNTPNLSSRAANTGVTGNKVTPAQISVPATPPIPKTPKRPNRQTDYTGFGLMTDSDGDNDSASNLSLTEELSSQLDNVLLREGVNSMGVESTRQENRPAKPPPPKPPAPNINYQKDDRHRGTPTEKEKPRPNPKPRRLTSAESEMTQM